jgi:hypothetical protein
VPWCRRVHRAGPETRQHEEQRLVHRLSLIHAELRQYMGNCGHMGNCGRTRRGAVSAVRPALPVPLDPAGHRGKAMIA